MSSQDTNERAAKIAKLLHDRIGARARTASARITDMTNFVTRGWIWADMGGTAIKVVCRTLDCLKVGDWIFIRKMEQVRWSDYIYDSFNQRLLPDGTIDYFPGYCPPGALYISVPLGGLTFRWPGKAGEGRADFVGPGSAPQVYDPSTRLIYYFGQAGTNVTTVSSLDPLTGASAAICSFTVVPAPVTLGGSHPTAPFLANPQGGNGITRAGGLPMAVVAAGLVGDQVYLGCQESSFGTGVVALVRFTPASGTATVVHGPLQATQYRPYLWPPFIGGVFYLYSEGGYAGDRASPGFVVALGEVVFWSAGALIFRSTTGDPGSWSLVYDGLGADAYLTGSPTYSRHQPGGVDPVSGSYLFGATGQRMVATACQDFPDIIQAQPYTVADGTNPNPDGPRFRSIPAVPLSEQSISPAEDGSFRVPFGFFVAGGLSHQPVSRAILALDTGGGVTVVFEDTREDVDIARAEMGPVAILYDGTNPAAGLGAISSGQTDWSPVTPVEPTFVNAGAGWASDPLSGGLFLTAPDPSFPRILAPFPFGYRGKLHVLTSPDGIVTRLVRRDSPSVWIVVSEDVGIPCSVPNVPEFVPPYHILSTSPRILI